MNCAVKSGKIRKKIMDNGPHVSADMAVVKAF